MLAQTESDVDMQLPGITDTVKSQQPWVAPASKARGRVGLGLRYTAKRNAAPLHSFGNPIHRRQDRAFVDS